MWWQPRGGSTVTRSPVGSGARVTASLPNTAIHVSTVFALVRLGGLRIPLNTTLPAAPPTHLLRDSGATHLVAIDGSDIAAAVGADRRERCGQDIGSGAAWPDDGEQSARRRECGSARPCSAPRRPGQSRSPMYVQGT